MDRRARHIGSRGTLVLGLAVVFGIFIAEAIVDSFLSSSAIARARGVEARSMASLEKLSRISRDLDQERILLDEHTYEGRPEAVAAIEGQLDALVADFRETGASYAPLIDQPNEADLWRDVQGLLAGHRAGLAHTLALSRENRIDEARATMRGMRKSYAELDRKLFDLIQVNQSGAVQATAQVRTMMNATDNVVWAARGAGLVALVFLGSWLLRRIGRYESQITAHARALEERNRDLDAFAGRVAHDLKNALEPLLLTLALLRRSNTNPTRVLEITTRIERYSRRATAVVDALLAFSRASIKSEEHEWGELSTVVKDVLDELAPRIEELEATVEVEPLPDLRLRCNPGLLHIVLANLCGNAVKYLVGQSERRVRVSARAEGSFCWIEIADTGPGIPEEAQEKIFEPFFRVEGTRAHGTGIGLATVRRIVDGCAGRVAVESNEGRGSRFRLWLPLAPAAEDRAAQQPSTEEPVVRY